MFFPQAKRGGVNAQMLVPYILKDWVPIINGDIQKQKNHRHQPPYSDAYNQGMPAKRRKVFIDLLMILLSGIWCLMPLSTIFSYFVAIENIVILR
jgi:hypothetical protein